MPQMIISSDIPEITKDDVLELYDRLYHFFSDCGADSRAHPIWAIDLKDIIYETLGVDVNM